MSQQPSFRVNPVIAIAVGVIVLIVAGIPIGGLVADELSGSGGSDKGHLLKIVSPLMNESVTSPFTLRIDYSGFDIADPAEGEEGAYHYHAFVDIHPFTPAGQAIPESESIYHFWDDELELDLPPGEHTIIVALGGNDEVRPFDEPAAAVDITVSE